MLPSDAGPLLKTLEFFTISNDSYQPSKFLQIFNLIDNQPENDNKSGLFSVTCVRAV